MSISHYQNQKQSDGVSVYSNWVIKSYCATAINSVGELVNFQLIQGEWGIV